MVRRTHQKTAGKEDRENYTAEEQRRKVFQGLLELRAGCFIVIQVGTIFWIYTYHLCTLEVYSMKLRFAALTLCLLAALLAAPYPAGAGTPAPSSEIDFVRLDSLINAQMEKHGLRGVALAVTQGEQIVYLKGYGTAGQGRAMTPQTPMYIGSQSKSVTALAIAQLAEQGKVELNAPVRKYIPWFAVTDPQASQQITINHLLYHTSGLSEAGYTAMLPDDATLEEGIRSLSSAKLTAPVGSKHQYFNMGYCVLMQVIETASGEKYADYIQEHIFEPLGMRQTYTDPAAARANGLSQGYSRFFGFTVPWPQSHLAYQLGDGYIISSAEDMARYAIAMNNHGVYQGASLLSPERVQLMFMPVQGYGMGWSVEPGHIYHGGANETFKTFVDLYPGRGLGIVLLINQGYMLDHYISATQVFDGVEAIVLGKQPPVAGDGPSVRLIGWGMLVFVLGLCALHTWNIVHLRGWKERASRMTPFKRAWDVAISFLIPTVILLVVFSQVKGYFGYRFNLTYQMVTMFRFLPDISILMLVGSVPDYAQGIAKLVWLLARKTKLRTVEESKEPAVLANSD